MTLRQCGAIARRGGWWPRGAVGRRPGRILLERDGTVRPPVEHGRDDAPGLLGFVAADRQRAPSVRGRRAARGRRRAAPARAASRSASAAPGESGAPPVRLQADVVRAVDADPELVRPHRLPAGSARSPSCGGGSAPCRRAARSGCPPSARCRARARARRRSRSRARGRRRPRRRRRERRLRSRAGPAV